MPKLKFNPDKYTPYSLRKLSENRTTKSDPVRAEYSRLSRIMRQRLDRMAKTEWADTQFFKNYNDYFVPLNQIQSDRELYFKLALLGDLINRDTTSISGMEKQRREAIKTLHEHGYNFVNKKNFKAFGEFMEYARIAGNNRDYDFSERAAELFNEIQKKKIPVEDLSDSFQWWIDNVQNLSKLKGKPGGKTAADYKQEIQKKR